MSDAKASCESETNSHLRQMYKQVCFASQQKAHHLVYEQYTSKEIRNKASLRGIDSQSSLSDQRSRLEDCITRELYLLDLTGLELQDEKTLHSLAKALHLDPSDFRDNIHLAWMIVMVIVRDKIPYKLNRRRNIVLTGQRKNK